MWHNEGHVCATVPWKYADHRLHASLVQLHHLMVGGPLTAHLQGSVLHCVLVVSHLSVFFQELALEEETETPELAKSWLN
jgi:hypothetical protein